MKQFAFLIFLLSFFCGYSQNNSENSSGFQSAIGHSAETYAITVSRSAQYLLSAHSDNIIRLWNIAGGVEIKQFSEHKRPVKAVQFLPDDLHFVSGSEDKEIRLWSLLKDSSEAVFKGHKGRITCMDVSADGRFLLSGDDANTIILWSIPERKKIAEYTNHKNDIIKLEFIDSDSLFLSSAEDETMILWSIMNTQPVRIFKGQSDNIVDFFTLFNTNLCDSAIVAFDKKKLVLWNFSDGKKEDENKYRFDEIVAVELSPDKNTFIVGQKNGDIHAWTTEAIFSTDSPFEPEYEAYRRSFVKHSETICDLEFLPEGKSLISAASDKQIIQWNYSENPLVYREYNYIDNELPMRIYDNKTLRNAEIQARFETTVEDFFRDKSLYLLETAFNPKKNFMVGRLADNSLFIWQKSTGETLSLEKPKNKVKCIAVSPNEDFFVTGDVNNDITIRNLPDGAVRYTLSGHTKNIASVCVSPDGKTIASAGNESVVKFWDVQTGKEKFSTIPTFNTAEKLIFSPDGTKLFVLTYDKLVTFNTEDGKKIEEGPWFGWAKAVAISENGQFIAGVSDMSNAGVTFNGNEYYISVFDVINNEIVKTFFVESEIRAIQFDESGKKLTAFCENGLYEWNLETPDYIRTFEKTTSSMRPVLSRDGKSILFADDNFISYWDFSSGKRINSFREHEISPDVLTLSRDKSLAASGRAQIILTSTRDLKFWNTKNGKQLGEVTDFDGISVNSLTFSPDGSQLILTANSTKKENRCVLFDVATGKKIKTFPVNSTAWCSPPEFSNSGKYLAVPDESGTISLLNFATGTKIRDFKGHNGNVASCLFSNDDLSLYTASHDFSIKIWDIISGENLKTMKSHDDAILCLAKNRQETMLASGGLDKKVIVWDIKSGKPVHSFSGHQTCIHSVVFTEDGTKVLSASCDGTVKIWDIKTLKEILTINFLQKTGDWLASTPEGHFDGTENGMKSVCFLNGLELIPMESFFDSYYTPDLIIRILNNEKIQKPEFGIKNMKAPPKVKFAEPRVGSEMRADRDVWYSANERIEIDAEISGNDSDITEIRLYQNGKLIRNETRDINPILSADGNYKVSKKFAVNLVSGENEFTISAFNSRRTESVPDKIKIAYEPIDKNLTPSCDLYILAVGINRYKNSNYNLTYCVPDAQAFVDSITEGSKTIFNRTYAYFLNDQNAVKDSIVKNFERIKQNSRSSDVFIFYYAGHGVIGGETGSEFFLVPHDVTSLYGNENMLISKGISATYLRDISSQIKSQKQLFVLDACQSGEATEVFSMRGAVSEKAIMQLARSAGIAMFSASGSDQYATEFKEIGHGVFTYSILEGLQGKADGSNNDKKITVNELKSYIDDRVPELTQKYRGQAQYPQSFIKGMDFPVVIIKN